MNFYEAKVVTSTENFYYEQFWIRAEIVYLLDHDCDENCEDNKHVHIINCTKKVSGKTLSRVRKERKKKKKNPGREA